MTLIEEPYKSGILFIPPQKFLKKSWSKRFCALYPSSKHGMQRLEMFESESSYFRQNYQKLIPLNDCIKVCAAPQKHHSNAFEVHTKDAVHVFSAESFQELSDWLSAFESVVFGSYGRDIVQHEENLVYSSLNTPEVYKVTVIETEASLRCQAQGEYFLVLDSSSIVLSRVLTSGGVGEKVFSWRYQHVRRFGCSKDVFSFEAGRKCSTGEGLFSFHASDGNLIFQSVDAYVNQLKGSGTAPEPPRRQSLKPSASSGDHLYEDVRKKTEPTYTNLVKPSDTYGKVRTKALPPPPVQHIVQNDAEYAQVLKAAK